MILTLLASAIDAAVIPLPDCTSLNLYGCGGATNVIATAVIPNVAIFMLRIIASLAVVFTVWAGITMMLTQGDSGKAAAARWSIIYGLGGFMLAMSAQMIVGYVATENFGQGNFNDFIIGGVFRSGVRIMLTFVNVILASIMTIQGIRMILAQGKADEFNTARGALLHAVMGAIVVNASVAIVRIVATFFGV